MISCNCFRRVTLLVRFGAPDGVIFKHYLIDAQLRLHVVEIHWLVALSAVRPGSFNVCTGFSRDIADSSGIQCWMPRWRLGLGESGPTCSVQDSDLSACSSRAIRLSSLSDAAHELYMGLKRDQ